MRVAEHLGDREGSAWFERMTTLSQSSSAIRDLAQGRTQENEVKTCLRDVGLRGVAKDRPQIRNARLVRSSREPFDHCRLNVDPDRVAVRLYPFRRRDQ